MRIIEAIIPALTVASLLVLGACSEQQVENPRKTIEGTPTVEQTRSQELQRVQFRDVPVPKGFQLVTRGNRSYSFQGGGVRVAGLQYWGTEPPEEVVAFYNQTMPLSVYGWRPAGRKDLENASVLTFEKNGQSCEVTIAREEGATVIKMKIAGPTE